MHYALKGKEGEKMRVKKSNMNTLIMRVYSKMGINLNVVKHPCNQCEGCFTVTSNLIR